MIQVVPQSPGIFKNADFVRLFFGQFFVFLASQAYQIAQLWWIVSHNPSSRGRGLDMAIVLGALTIPKVFLVKWIGTWVDRLPTKRILLFGYGGAAFTSSLIWALSIRGTLEFFEIVFLSFLMAFFQAFLGPTLAKAIPNAVRRQNYRVNPRYDLKFPIFFSAQGIRTKGMIRNLSVSGCFIETQRQLALDTGLSVDLELSGNLASLGGNVVRIEPRRTWATPQGVGIKFVSLSEAQFQDVQTIVQKLEKDYLQTAVLLMSSTFSVASIGGAALGASMIGFFGLSGVLLFNASCCLLTFFVTAGVKSALDFTPQRETTDEKQAYGRDKSDRKVFRYLWKLPIVNRSLIAYSAICLILGPITIILPAYVRNTLAKGSHWLALFETSLWVGVATGTYIAKKTAAMSAFRVAGLCELLCGICLIMLSLQINIPIDVMAIFFAGLFHGLSTSKIVIYFHENILEDLKGRFFALFQSFTTTSFLASYLLCGPLVDYFSVDSILLVQGFALFGVASLLFHLSVKNIPLMAPFAD